MRSSLGRREHRAFARPYKAERVRDHSRQKQHISRAEGLEPSKPSENRVACILPCAATSMPVLTLPSSESGSIRAKALVFEDPQSRALLARIQQVAPSDATVLLCGETGTGKEIVARQVHELSARRARAFVGVNCGALTESLVESELFGHERGAFTGAVQSKAGWFETAHGGTLFLDEIGDIPLATQVKLLRVLQEGEIVRLGARAPEPVDVRLIAATNVDLQDAVRAGRFREDLYYRLNVAPLTILPLRDRPADILPIAQYFLQSYGRRLKLQQIPELGSDAVQALLSHGWPGNIRELENAIHHALLVGCGATVRSDDLRLPSNAPLTRPRLADGPRATQATDSSLEASFESLFEQGHPNLFEHVVERLVLAAYQHCERNQVHTARLLGISRNVLRARLQQVGELGGSRAREAAAPALRANSPEPIRVGYQRYGLLPLMKASGALERAFAAHGVAVEWREFAGGMQLLDALEHDGLSLGLVGEVPPIFAQAAQLPMVYLAAEAPAPDHEAIVVAPGSEIQSVEELRGKTVLLSRGSNVQYFLILALEAARLTYADIRVVYATPDRAQALFASGQVDAWATWEPFLSDVRQKTGARVLRSARGLTANTSYYVGARSFVDQQPRLVTTFLDQLRDVGRWAELEREAATGLLAAALSLPPTAAGPILAGARAPEPFDACHRLSQQNIADTFHRLGLVETKIDVAAACWRPAATAKATASPSGRPARA
jgi:aliphatic sulfonates family ABC transporter substrate-binding protein